MARGNRGWQAGAAETVPSVLAGVRADRVSGREREEVVWTWTETLSARARAAHSRARLPVSTVHTEGTKSGSRVSAAYAEMHKVEERKRAQPRTRSRSDPLGRASPASRTRPATVAVAVAPRGCPSHLVLVAQGAVRRGVLTFVFVAAPARVRRHALELGQLAVGLGNLAVLWDAG